MKKVVANSMIVLLFILNVTITAGFAFTARLRLGASVNYFAPAEPAYRDLYGQGGIAPACSLSFDLLKQVEIRAEVSYFQDKGKMSLSRENIRLSLLTAVLGFRGRFIESKLLSPYAGAGLALVFYKEDVPQRLTGLSGMAKGMAFEAGTYIKATKRLYADVNIRYVVEEESEPFNEAVKLGGLFLGIGVGYSF